MQRELDEVANWSLTWQMKFNVEKCKVMHTGNRNQNYNYTMLGKTLVEVSEEKDLGVVISNDLKSTKQSIAACQKANKVLGFIARNFEYKTPNVVMSLYKALVRPHLEYAIQFWSPHYRKDIERLEKVQRRATKLIPGLRNKPYEERLKELKLFSLEKRRLRGDLIEVFKILNKMVNVEADNLFHMQTDTRTRNNGWKLKGKRFNTDIGKYWFTNRVIEHWNRLPPSVVNAQTIDTFKKQLDVYLLEIGVY